MTPESIFITLTLALAAGLMIFGLILAIDLNKLINKEYQENQHGTRK